MLHCVDVYMCFGGDVVHFCDVSVLTCRGVNTLGRLCVDVLLMYDCDVSRCRGVGVLLCCGGCCVDVLMF